MSIVNTIADLKDKVMEWVKSYAAPKTHIEERASSSKLGHVVVDTNLKSPSSNPVSGQAIKEALNNIEDSSQVKTNTDDIKTLKETLAYYQKIIGEPTSIEVYRSINENDDNQKDKDIKTTRLMIDLARYSQSSDYKKITIKIKDKDNNTLGPSDFQNNRADFFWIMNNNMRVTRMGYASDGSEVTPNTKTIINVNLNPLKSDWTEVSTDRYELKDQAGYPFLIFFNEYKNPKYQRSYCLKRIVIIPKYHSGTDTIFLTKEQYNMLN